MGAEHAASDEQWAAITAPLRPTVVVAGAGSGKTTLMAQRVVWLVATGKVRPEEVLGLTFTTKAAAELRHRVTAALGAAGLLDRSVVAEGEDVLEPTVATYHAYAATLLTDHGLRIGHEPDTRVVSDASRYQLGARVIERFTGPHRAADRPPRDRHPEPPRPRRRDERAPRRRGRRTPHRRGGTPRLRARDRRGGGRQGPHDLPRAARQGDQRHRPPRRAAPARPRLPHAQGRPRADGLRRPDRPRRAAGRRPARGGRARAGAVQGRDARRVPGHLGRAGHDAGAALRRRPPGDGGRRPQPGDLRLARRLGVQHPQLRRDLPGRRRRGRAAAADGQPPLRPPHPRGRQPAGRAPAGGLRRQGRPAARGRDRGGGPCRGPRLRAGVRRAGLARRRGARGARRRHGVGRHRRAEPRQRAGRGGLRHPHLGGDPGRDRRPVRPDPAARGRGGRRDPDADARRHRQLLDAHPADRSALGDRSSRPAAAGDARCRDRGRTRPQGGRQRRRPAAPDRRRHRRLRAARAERRRRVARRGGLLLRGDSTGSPSSPPSCAGCAPTSATRCSTWCAGSSTPPASTSSWRRRPRPRRPRAATTSTCSSRRSRSSSPSTATSRSRRCWPTSPPRTTRATASTSRRRPPPTRSSCSPSTAPRASSGRRCSASAWGRPASRATARARCGRPRRPSCPRRCGATAPTSRSWPGTTRPRSTPTAPPPRPTTPRRSCASATSPSPARPTTSP